MNRRALELINTLLFVFAILGTNAIELLGLEIGSTERIAASILMVVVYLLVAREKQFEKVHSFQEDSRKFSDFFREWYSRSGKLSIFCTDLEWLDSPEHAGIVDALRHKGNKLHLYLRNDGGDRIARELLSGGANFYKVKDSIRTSHRLSVLDNEGIQSIIIRNKDITSDDIVFIETNSYRDPYIIGLALDMMEDCYDQA